MASTDLTALEAAGAVVSETSLQIASPEGLSWDEYQRLGTFLGGLGRGYPWWSRFIEKIKVAGECWLWCAAVVPRPGEDYGKFYLNGRLQYAHRVSYETAVAPIPTGLQLDHLCRTPRCVRPDHLAPVTGAENRRRGRGFSGLQSSQTHCIHGHPFDEENTYHWRGHRLCRTCRRERRKLEAT